MSRAEPSIARSISLNFMGDWGQANFHRICSWLTQEFCDRAGPRSQVAIRNMRGGGLEGPVSVHEGASDLCISTPAMLLPDLLTGNGLFAGRPMPELRALAVLPQNDRLLLAIDPKYGIATFDDLRAKKPPLTIAVSADDGTNFIGHITQRYMEAHGIDESTLNSWGGAYLATTRPEQSLAKMVSGEADAVIQEAVMTPWWAEVMQSRQANVLAAEPDALAKLNSEHGYRHNSMPAKYWDNLPLTIDALDFSDFAIIVRSDMPDDIAHLLTWCLVETRDVLERQYRHLAPERSPLTWPIEPRKMAQTPIPLHPAAKRYYREAELLAD